MGVHVSEPERTRSNQNRSDPFRVSTGPATVVHRVALTVHLSPLDSACLHASDATEIPINRRQGYAGTRTSAYERPRRSQKITATVFAARPRNVSRAVLPAPAGLQASRWHLHKPDERVHQRAREAEGHLGVVLSPQPARSRLHEDHAAVLRHGEASTLREEGRNFDCESGRAHQQRRSTDQRKLLRGQVRDGSGARGARVRADRHASRTGGRGHRRGGEKEAAGEHVRRQIQQVEQRERVVEPEQRGGLLLVEHLDSLAVAEQQQRAHRRQGGQEQFRGFASIAKPPPPPPPPPPPDREDVVVLVVNTKQEAIGRDGKKDGVAGETNRDGKSPEHGVAATNKSDVSCGEHQQPEVPPASPPADTEEIKASQASHLVNRHMVLPFIPPKFANADSNTLLKPSEYLKSICKTSAKNSLSKARSVDNLDIQGRGTDRREIAAIRDRKELSQEEEEEEEEDEEREGEETEAEGRRAEPAGDQEKQQCSGPPPPPLSPLQKLRRNGEETGAGTGSGANMGTSATAEADQPMAKAAQPLATISIQDLTSIQLRRTTAKMNATKTFSAPPPRSVSMTNVSEAFFVQKTDLIAELKKTKDIPGIKKLKVEMAQVEKTQEQNLMSEISKAFSASNFVDQIPEKDSSGNLIPIWKRQMLARKAAERAKKELEEQIARENEERRQKAIPAWKRQLLAKKDTEEKKTQPIPVAAKMEAPVSQKRDASPNRAEEKVELEEKKSEASPPCKSSQPTEPEEEADTVIIPWRAQLRKTNSKLSILD